MDVLDKPCGMAATFAAADAKVPVAHTDQTLVALIVQGADVSC